MARGYRYYSVDLKSGKTRRRVHDAKTGRIKKWVDVDDLYRPEGEFKIMEYVMNFKPTNVTGRPSGLRDWEVRITAPEGGYTLTEIKNMGESVLSDLCNEEMVNTSEFDWKTRGIDFIYFDDSDKVEWKVMDTVRPQFHYPKKGWGSWDEE